MKESIQCASGENDNSHDYSSGGDEFAEHGFQSPAAPAPNIQRAGRMRMPTGNHKRRLIFAARFCCMCHVRSRFAAISSAFVPIRDSNSSSFQKVPARVARAMATRTHAGAVGKMPKRENRSVQPTRPDVIITGRGFTTGDNTL